MLRDALDGWEALDSDLAEAAGPAMQVPALCVCCRDAAFTCMALCASA